MPRRIHRTDHAQQAIVDGLRKMGVKVWTKLPCDLLTLYWSSKYQTFLWQPLEAKTPNKAGKRVKRYDQAEQDEFIASTGTPVVLSLDEAVAALKLL